MRLFALWLHVLGVVVWLGGITYQVHVLVPTARREGAATFAAAARRARPVAWTALGVVVLTGLYALTRLGSVENVMSSGAALALATKLFLVLLLVTLAGQRDFAQVPRLTRALAANEETAAALRAIAWLDRITIALGVAIVYLGLTISRS